MFGFRHRLLALCAVLTLLVAAGVVVLGQDSFVGQTAKDFTLVDINPNSPTYQEQVTLSNSRGAILVLFFFTPRGEGRPQQTLILSAINSDLWPKYKSGCVRLFTIAGFTGETTSDALGMVPKGADFPVLFDSGKQAWGARIGDLYRAISESRVPLAVIIDHDFTIQFYKFGYAHPEDYVPEMDQKIADLGPDDSDPPVFENFTPPDGATEASLCTRIEFDVMDNCGVDIDTLSFSYAGSPAVTWETEPIAGGYHVVVTPQDGCWPPTPPGGSYLYTIGCSDWAGNEGSQSYSFSTVSADTTDPVWTNKVPAENAQNVDPNITISFDIYDDESCIDRDGMRVYIQQQSEPTERDVTATADYTALAEHEGWHISYKHFAAFTVGEWVQVHLVAPQLCGASTLDATYRFWVGTGGPTFANEQPPDGAEDIDPSYVEVSVDVLDPTSDIDYYSIDMRLNGEVKLVHKERIDYGYHVWFAARNLDDGTRYKVTVYATNTATNPKSNTHSWTFTTTDTTPPRITAREPTKNAYNVPTDTAIWFWVADTGVGVDPTTITMRVGATQASILPRQLNPGDDSVYEVYYTPAREFVEGEVVTVTVDAADKKGNWMPTDSWEFTCSAVPTVKLAGWGPTYISATSVGEFYAYALVEYGQGMPKIRNVQIYTEHPVTKQHYPVGIFLRQIGNWGRDGIFFYHEFIPPGNSTGMMPIYEIAAEDVYGKFSALWPYLTIVDKSAKKSPPPIRNDFDPTELPWRYQALLDRFGGSEPLDVAELLQQAAEGFSRCSKPASKGPNARPVIFAGGFSPPLIDISKVSTVRLTAVVIDPDGNDDIERVEIYVDGMPTGVFLLDDGTQPDDIAGDNFFVRDFIIPPYSQPVGLLLLQVIAFDREGNISNVYPYVTVEP